MMADLLEGHPISEKKMKEVLGHTPLQASGQISSLSELRIDMRPGSSELAHVHILMSTASAQLYRALLFTLHAGGLRCHIGCAGGRVLPNPSDCIPVKFEDQRQHAAAGAIHVCQFTV